VVSISWQITFVAENPLSERLKSSRSIYISCGAGISPRRVCIWLLKAILLTNLIYTNLQYFGIRKCFII